MAGVTADIALSIIATLTGANDLGNPKQRVAIEKALNFAPGTDATNKLNVLFSDTRTLGASANEDLDLAGVLANAFGATVAAAEVTLIMIVAADGNTNNVNVTRPASNGVPLFLAAGDGVAVKPGEFQLFVSKSGIAVTAGTGDLINIANSAGTTSVTYDILVLGRTVAA